MGYRSAWSRVVATLSYNGEDKQWAPSRSTLYLYLRALDKRDLYTFY
jgi:hypothetical protein